MKSAEPALRDDALEDVQALREALSESLDEIRSLSSGLAPPEVGVLAPAEVLKLVAHRHARRTGTRVHLDLGDLPAALPYTLKACIYRFVQECLSNAFRHAEGAGQGVTARYANSILEVEVSDNGPGFVDRPRSAAELMRATSGQGLTGLRDRVEFVGGHFTLRSEPGAGTRVSARFMLSSCKQGVLSDVT